MAAGSSEKQIQEMSKQIKSLESRLKAAEDKTKVLRDRLKGSEDIKKFVAVMKKHKDETDRTNKVAILSAKAANAEASESTKKFEAE